jgi:hypothetical protein
MHKHAIICSITFIKKDNFQKDMTGEPKASQSPSEASKTRYHACSVEYFICSSLVNSYTNY